MSYVPRAVIAPLSLAILGLVALMLVSPYARAADATVSITTTGFTPMSASIETGDMVTWDNDTDETCTIVFIGGGPTSPGAIAAAASGSATFSAAGTFTYQCDEDDTYTGTVIVEDPATETPTNTPTATGTTTGTATNTPTSTPTGTATTAPTSTPTRTSTPTATVSATSAASATAIATPRPPETGAGQSSGSGQALLIVAAAIAMFGTAGVVGLRVAGRRNR